MTRHDAPLLAWIEGIGLRGPGLPGWAASADILAGRVEHVEVSTVLVAPAALPPAERRRVGKGVKIALDVGFEAVAHAGLDAAFLPSVFTSSSGDGDNCDAICRSLADDRLISPTRFHNSVHNAPSGYWGIASHSMAPSTSLCAYDDSFAAGLDDALTQLAGGIEAIVLVAYDAPYPEPLHAARPTPDTFGIALVLTRAPGPRAVARIEMRATAVADPHRNAMHIASLERVRSAIPAARALPLLAAIATGDERTIVLEDAQGTHRLLHVQSISSPTPVNRESHTQCA